MWYRLLLKIHLQHPVKMGLIYVFISVVIAIIVVVTGEKSGRPNIVFIIADDLGWDDVSFHGSDQIQTPNIDLLAYSGVVLERYYSHCLCTPSRAALLTGKFAHHLGMQGYPLTNGEDRGLPLTEKILPQYLKELGYSTHLVGKWHSGNSRKKYFPNERGFDSFFGHISGYIDYYEYVLEETWDSGKVSGFALYRNFTPAWDVEGYITDVYTEEAVSIIKNHDVTKPLFLNIAHNAPHSGNQASLMQAPPEDVRAMRHVELPERRTLAAMLKKLDESIGNIVEALLNKDMLQNTIIAFVSDNGGMTTGDPDYSVNYGSNWPLRGFKMSPFEGGIRVVGLLWTPTLTHHLWKGRMHVVDWLPTLLKAAGADDIPDGIDGIDLWNQITTNADTSRNDIFEIDDYTGFAAIIAGDYKLVTANVSLSNSDYQGDDLRGVIGEAPPYEDTIRKSKMYSILEKIGKPFNMDNIDLREKIRVDCKGRERNSSTACYPLNGEFAIVKCVY
ncbi:arylsulfatase J-like isoform X2 [Plodia interpunctella]|uniref:arylsulfatase J-like isoform X2 n=1 Tax=Plodia interpunctella TaxID=58824 RepID=UPI002367D2B7|nr:arylsulfatase J-like isoform X2 [Plodia interpunctella]